MLPLPPAPPFIPGKPIAECPIPFPPVPPVAVIVPFVILSSKNMFILPPPEAPPPPTVPFPPATPFDDISPLFSIVLPYNINNPPVPFPPGLAVT